ncbi:MAG: exo-alpha-sialidase [Myxococcales bacterium]|nr:exo-alpha-sialidase [Myxococcales bacterium]
MHSPGFRWLLLCLIGGLVVFGWACTDAEDNADDDNDAGDDDTGESDDDDDDDNDNDNDNDDDNDDVYFAEQDLYVNHVDGYPVFRIPSVIETTQGTLLAFCEGRDSILDDGNIDIVLKRSFDDGLTWTALQVVIDNDLDTAGNPAPVVDRDTGTIWLPYCTNPAHDMNNRRVFITSSEDDGETWAAPIEITEMTRQNDWTWNATGPGRSIQLRSGRFVVPGNHRTTGGESHSHILYSDDGLDWRIGGILGPDTDESQVAELDDGSLIINMRDLSAEHRRQIARSDDEGLTWSATTYDDALPDPSCQGSLLQTPYGLLFSNPVGEVEILRHDLTVRLSEDGGETWAASKLLHPGPSAYSALSILPDGRLGCLYENGPIPFLPYKKITWAVFSAAWLRE